MTTAYTSLLGLALPVTGELSGTWGQTVNDSITSLLDSAVAGTTTLSTDADVTLTTTTLAANQAREAILLFSGARTALRNVTAPAQSKIYTVINATTGGFSVVLRGAGPTTGVTILAGESAVCAWNGSDFIKISNAAGSSTFYTVTATAPTTASSNLGAYRYGTLSFSDTGIVQSMQTSVNSYFQNVMQNTNAGASASAEFIAYNDQGTATTNYATVGINSSGYSGTGSINAAGYGYFLTASTDLVLGTIGANGIHFTTNSSATDALAISSAGAVSLPGGTANGVAYLNGSKVLTTGSALVFDGTNLGVGTSSPQTKLDVLSANTATDTIGNAFIRTSDTQAADVGGKLTLGGLYNGSSYYAFGGIAGKKENSTSGNVAGYLQFLTTTSAGALTERARIDSAGNLGLGVTPSAWTVKALQGPASFSIGNGGDSGMNLLSNAYYGSAWTYISTAAASWYQQLSGAHKWYTAASGTAGNAITFTQAMTLDASGNLGIGVTSPNTAIDVRKGASAACYISLSGNNSPSTSLFVGQDSSGLSRIFQNGANPITFWTNGSEAARIDSSGNLLVGLTSASTTPTQGVSVYGNSSSVIGIGHATGTPSNNGYALFSYNGTLIGAIVQAGTTGVLYNVTSDYRLKDVIGAVSGSGQRIDALEPVEYTWKADGSPTRGFLAHKFQEVYAGSVSGTKDAVDVDGNPVYQSMQAGSSEVIADLVAEIQSLRKRLAALESK